MDQQTVAIHATSTSSPGKDTNAGCIAEDVKLEKLVSHVAAELNAGSNDAWLLIGGILAVCLLVSLVTYSPTLFPLVYLGFAMLCLPYRVANFVCRKWTFFLVDFCYFANLACCAFLLFRPEDRRWEAAVYALCEGPLAAALIAWQCAWVLGSPDHVISVLIHLLPGLALYCHRFLAFTRRPSLLATQIGIALLSDTDPWATAAEAESPAGGPGVVQPAGTAARWGRRLAAAAAVSRGRVPCPAFAAATTPTAQGEAWGLRGGGLPSIRSAPSRAPAGTCLPGVGAAATSWSSGAVECFAGLAEAPPGPCPAPAWLWLGAAPLAFYLSWQLLYFLIVQVACRRLILAGGYDTSYRALARRAQRANSPLNRLVRRGSLARRLFMYGLLQLLFTLVTQALAVATYHSFAAATAWQVVKFVLPLYLGACHQCHRLPAQQLRAAAARLAAAGALAPEAPRGAGPASPEPHGVGSPPVVQARAES